MTEATNELMYELLKRVHHEVAELRQDVSEVKRELNVVRGHMVATQATSITSTAFLAVKTIVSNA